MGVCLEWPVQPQVRRVLMTASTAGSVWTYALELGRGLVERGVEVVLATLGAPLDEEQWGQVRAVPGLRVEQGRWQPEWRQGAWEAGDVERSGRWLLGLEEQHQPDVVHLNGYCHGALPWARRPLVVGHGCVLAWWQTVRGEPAPGPWWKLYRWEARRGLNAAGRVVVPTSALREALEAQHGPLPHVRVIPHGRRAEELLPEVVREPFILCAGRLWDDAKNVGVLEALAPRLAWPVVVAGESRHPSGGEVRSRHVKLLGRVGVEELGRWMRRASLYVLPARHEPFGMSALEAALAGCPLVLGDVASLREVWGESALLVPPEDVQGLERAIRGLVEDPVLRARMATRARTRALELNPERMVEAYLQAYQELLGSAEARQVSVT